MFYVIVYDIPESEGTLREKIAQILKDYGLERVQYSVFTGNLSKNLMEMAMLEILDEIKGKTGDVKVYPIANADKKGIHIQDGELEYVVWQKQQNNVIVI